MKCHNTTAGAQEEFQSSENERERTGHGGEEEKQRERIIRREGDKEHAEKTGRRDIPDEQSSSPNPFKHNAKGRGQ